MAVNGSRRAFVHALARRTLSVGGLFALAPLARLAAAQQSGGSAAEQLVAAMQDGGKIIYLRYWGSDPRDPRGGQTPTVDQARELGRAMQALRVPLNDIVHGPAAQARRVAEVAFGTDRVRAGTELASLFHTIPGPGMNRVIVGERVPLEMAAERRFSDAVLPDGAMAVFLPGQTPQLLGTITAERVILSATARGAL